MLLCAGWILLWHLQASSGTVCLELLRSKMDDCGTKSMYVLSATIRHMHTTKDSGR